MAQFLKKQLKSAISSTNHLLGRYRDKILILGDGRSGTNWLLEIINYDKRLRLIYEPFHGAEFRPKLSPDIEYPSADAKLAAELSTQLSRAARGAYLTKNVTIEFPRLFYDGLIIKDVNAHLIADDLDQAMPDLKKVLILRHPFAVALSKSRYKGHSWLADYDSETISHGMEILEGFGMDRLYIDQHFPKLSADLLSQALTGNARSWLS